MRSFRTKQNELEVLNRRSKPLCPKKSDRTERLEKRLDSIPRFITVINQANSDDEIKVSLSKLKVLFPDWKVPDEFYALDFRKKKIILKELLAELRSKARDEAKYSHIKDAFDFNVEGKHLSDQEAMAIEAYMSSKQLNDAYEALAKISLRRVAHSEHQKKVIDIEIKRTLGLLDES